MYLFERIFRGYVEIKFGVINLAVKKRKKRKDNRIKYEVIGILFIAASVLIFLGLYKNSAGIFGRLIRDYLLGLFGLGAYGIPLFLLVGGAFYIARMEPIRVENKAISLLFLFISLVTLIHLLSGGGQLVVLRENMTFIGNIKENIRVALNYGLEKRGGGIAGAISSVLLVKVLGMAGSKIILVAVVLMTVTVISDRSIVSIMFRLVKGMYNMLRASLKTIRNFVMVPVKEEIKINSETSNKEEKSKVDIDELNRKIEDKIKILDFTTNIQGQNEVAAASEDVEVNLHKPNYVKEYSGYRLPSTSLLNSYEGKSGGSRKDLLNSARKLEETLSTFGVEAKVVQVSVGPAITRYEIQPSPGVKVSRILNLADDIALSMAATSVRIEAPIPGKSAIGLEIPNKEVSAVSLKEIIESGSFYNHSSNIAVALGKDIAGNPVVADLSKMPHLLIAGATGSGKSVCINCIITSMLFKASPAHVKLIMIDPKMVELNHFNGIPHLLAPVVTDPRKATNVLNWAVQEMTNRYKEFAQIGVKDIFRYNQVKRLENSDEYMPQIVVIIDELSDLMMVSPAEVEDAICRLAQMARAAGIHLVIATQRPSVDVITGVIKANIPSRISFAVSSQVDSRTILDINGAEKLLGRGDMLYFPAGELKPIRIQGALVEEEEIEKVVNFIKNQVEAKYSEEVMEAAKPRETDDEERDELLPAAIEVVVENQQASASLLQRKLKIGYARAARIIDQMEERGLVGPHEGSKPRKVLIGKETFEEMNK
jgi:S-DNA-T family DNA segregation ATPase FtsK/SpoIIIE